MKSTLNFFSDGGARGNPGPSACGWIVFVKDKPASKGSKYLGIGTNNQAEYAGVIEALDWLLKNFEKENPDRINFFLDSQLVTRQLTGEYKIKDPKLAQLAKKVNLIRKKIPIKIKFNSIAREKNYLADKLVNDCLDSYV